MKIKLIAAAKWIDYQFNSIWNTWYFRRMCKKADKLHLIKGKRYWVIPAGNRLMIVNNDWMKQYNSLVDKKHRLDFVKLEAMAYYSTASGTLRERKPKKQ